MRTHIPTTNSEQVTLQEKNHLIPVILMSFFLSLRNFGPTIIFSVPFFRTLTNFLEYPPVEIYAA